MKSSFAKHGYRLVRGFLSPQETERLLEQVSSRRNQMQTVAVKARMNRSYHVIDGLEVQRDLPELFERAAGQLRDLVEEQAGVAIELMRDPKRALRVQHYRRKNEGFLWHLDGGEFGALLILENTNGGFTELLTPGLSRWLKPLPYLLFLFQGVLARAPTTKIHAGAGDLLILHGGEVIHRGMMQRDEGARTLLAASYDRVGKKDSRLWRWIAQRLNY